MRLPRVRFTLRRLMLMIVLPALVTALFVQSMRVVQRDRKLVRLERLLDEYRRAAARTEWAERMHQKGYVSKATLAAEKDALSKAGAPLGVGD